VILPAQMKREKLKTDLPQIFQSCTFNRSVTSPFPHPQIDTAPLGCSIRSWTTLSTGGSASTSRQCRSNQFRIMRLCWNYHSGPKFSRKRELFQGHLNAAARLLFTGPLLTTACQSILRFADTHPLVKKHQLNVPSLPTIFTGDRASSQTRTRWC
jgi:hypothetical protein